jgi:hypothetical protein
LRSELASLAAQQQQSAAAAVVQSAADIDPSLDVDMKDAAAKAAAQKEEWARKEQEATRKLEEKKKAAPAGPELDGVALPAEAEGVNFASKHAHKAKRIKLL